MPQTTLSVRIDEELKQKLDAFCQEAGLNTSVAINIFARTVVREQRIPFEISLTTDPVYPTKKVDE